MTSLPPHANEPAIAQFLDEDEAASLTEALLDLVETDPQSEEPIDSSDGLAHESKIEKPPVSIHKFRKRINPLPTQKSESAKVSPESSRLAFAEEKGSEVDLVHHDLRAAMLSSDVVKGSPESEETETAFETEEEIKSADSGEPAGVFFFDRPTHGDDFVVGDDGVYPQTELPTRISLAVKDFFGRKISELKSADGHHKTDQNQHSTDGVPGESGADQEVEQTSLATVAGSGFSEGASSETIAGSGGPPIERTDGSFSWICADRTAGQSRLGFDSEETDEEPVSVGTASRIETAEAVHVTTLKRSGCSQHFGAGGMASRRLGPPLLVSSDLAGIQTFRTRGVKVRDLHHGSSSTRSHHSSTNGGLSELDRILAAAIAALEPYKRDKVIVAMAAVAIISIGIFGWVAYSYISDWSDASANLRQSLLLGPLVLRSSAIGQRSTFALALGRKRSVGSVAVLASLVADRLVSTAQFTVTPLEAGSGAARVDTNRSFLVDLPRIETMATPGRVPGSPSVVNTKQVSQQPKPRSLRSANGQRHTVVNHRQQAGTTPKVPDVDESELALDAVIAEVISRLDTGPRQIRN